MTAGNEDERSTSAEDQLLERLADGRALDLATSEGFDWEDPDHAIRASYLRDLLRGGSSPHVDPRGISIRGATIVGRLDLSHFTLSHPIAFIACHFPAGLDLSHSTIPHVTLNESRFSSRSASALTLASARVGTLEANSIVADTDAAATSAVNLRNARIDDDLRMFSAFVESEHHFAVLADNITVGGSVFLNRLHAAGKGVIGDALRLNGARVSGQVELTEASLVSESRRGLDAEGLVTNSSLILCDATITGRGPEGAASINGARIGRQLIASNLDIECIDGPAFIADGITIDGDLQFRPSFSARANSQSGCIRMNGATIGGQASFSAGTISNADGSCLTLRAATIAMELFVDASVQASDEEGALKLDNCRIGGSAIIAATAHNDSGPALTLQGSQIGQDLKLRLELAGGGLPTTPVLRLAHLHVSGLLLIDRLSLTHLLGTPPLLTVDGLTYRGLPEHIGSDAWLRLLRESTTGYAAQPYRHLAAVANAAGHDRETRKILIAQREDQLQRTPQTKRQRLWAWIEKHSLGYGYKPARALRMLSILCVVSVILAIALGSLRLLVDAETEGACSTLDSIAFGASASIPVLDFDTSCQPAEGMASNLIAPATWIIQGLSWALATLFVAGFTSAVRRL